MRPEVVQAAKLLRSAEPESVSEAIGLLQNTVYSFSMKVCGHPEDAEDTMQEVLVRSLPHLAKIENPRALAVWLYTATRNRCWRMRRRPVNAPKETLSLDELMPDDFELGLLLQDPSPSPESRVLSIERADLVHKSILGVPPLYRMVLVLHDMEDLDPSLIGSDSSDSARNSSSSSPPSPTQGSQGDGPPHARNAGANPNLHTRPTKVSSK